LAYSSPPVSPGRLVVGSTWRVRRGLHQVEDPQHSVIAPDYVINIGLVALVIFQVRGSRLDLKVALRPVICVAAAAAKRRAAVAA
jgi:hypothetical protein